MLVHVEQQTTTNRDVRTGNSVDPQSKTTTAISSTTTPATTSSTTSMSM